MRSSIDYAYGGIVEYINDTAAHTGTFKYGVCVTDVVISAVTTNGLTATSNTITGETLPKGSVIPFSFSSITLTSGKMFAVRGL